jgi:hypothetical protein
MQGFRIWVEGTYSGWVEAVLQSWGATIECHARRGSWGPNPENRAGDLVSGVSMEMVAEGDGWWRCGDADEMVVVVGRCVCKREAGGGLGAENHETERDSSFLGAPCETTVKGDGGRWWCGAGKLVVVVGLCVRKCEAGEWAGDQKSRNIVRRLDFGGAA